MRNSTHKCWNVIIDWPGQCTVLHNDMTVRRVINHIKPYSCEQTDTQHTTYGGLYAFYIRVRDKTAKLLSYYYMFVDLLVHLAGTATHQMTSYSVRLVGDILPVNIK